MNKYKQGQSENVFECLNVQEVIPYSLAPYKLLGFQWLFSYPLNHTERSTADAQKSRRGTDHHAT